MPRALIPVLAALALAAPPVLAAGDESASARKDLKQTRSELEDRGQRIKALEVERREAEAALTRTRRSLVDAARQLESLQDDLRLQEQRLAGLDRKIADTRAALAARRSEITRLAGALVRLERAPRDRLATTPEDLLDTWRAGRLIAHITPALNARSAELKRDLEQLETAEAEARAVRQARLASRESLARKQGELDTLLDRRRQQVRALADSSRQERRKMAALTARAADLEELLTEIRRRQEAEAERRRVEAERRAAEARRRAEEARKRAEAERRRLAEEKARADRRRAEAERRQALVEAEAERRRAEAAAEAARLQAEAEAEARRQAEAERRREARARQAALRNTPPITHRKGRLPYPVVGRIVSRFGERNSEGRTQQGISIRSESGARVTAPHTGKVVFAGPFRRYGLVLIIAHGEGYHSLLAGMSRLDAEVGQSVLAGEPVGQMGRGSGDKRELYVELRRQGRAIDPSPWLVNRSGKVSG